MLVVSEYFFPSLINIWNCLPHNIVDSTNVNQFKQNMNSWASNYLTISFSVKCNFTN